MADRFIYGDPPVSFREMNGREGVDATGPNDSAERTFLLRGSDDPLYCRDALLNQTDIDVRNYDGLVLQSMARERAADTDWIFTLTYGNVPEVGGYVVSMDTSGGRATQTEALAQVAFPAPGETAIDYKTSVNVQDNEAQGVDRVVAALKLNVRAKISDNIIGGNPIGYAKLVAGMTGYVNNTPFLGFAAGELLFTGATGDIIGADPVLSFTFEASQNLTGVQIGPITGINKLGHDFIWFSYKASKDGAGYTSLPVRAAYVSTVYLGANFANLGIGVSAFQAVEQGLGVRSEFARSLGIETPDESPDAMRRHVQNELDRLTRQLADMRGEG